MHRHYAVFVALFGASVCLNGAVLAQSHDTHQHRFGNAEKWSKIFDDPKRDAWQKPHEVLKALKLAPNAAVADIGAGTGYFAARLAHWVPKGRVYAVDAEPDMVKFLGERAKREGLANLTPVTAAPESARLPAPVDLVLLVDVYHHIAKRDEYFAALRPSLKTGGRVAIIDFTMNTNSGPPKSARIAPERVKTEMASAGYRLAEEFGFLPEQFFLVFERATP
ncbi:MAG: class I SAM-dependent methyltransferase [Burkholderiales bacterium]